ncbi:hypothetical protein [Marinitoga sp. 1155]|uniref:hypothetical protein n=1 Tax=Marinitoga sp. 1155 TaxID=1428448 RepID=UPI000640C4E0|nr:hypothetical protein [Marinitoga sp. 1155]KLO23515.1 hypothetical protein X274_06405 [Marinitoga sp. 1155]
MIIELIALIGVNLIFFTLINLGFYDIISNFYIVSSKSDFFKLKIYILFFELIIAIFLLFFNKYKLKKLKIRPYKKYINFYSYKGFFLGVLILIFYNFLPIIISLWFSKYINSHPNFYDNYVVVLSNLIYPFRFFFYIIVKFIYFSTEFFLFYYMFNDNLKPVLMYYFINFIKPKRFKEGRNFYLDYYLYKIYINRENPQKINKYIDSLLKNIEIYNEIELAVIFSLIKLLSLNIDMEEKLNKLSGFLNFKEHKDLKNFLQFFNEEKIKNFHISFEALKEFVEYDDKYYEQKIEILLSSILYYIYKLKDEKNFSTIYFILSLIYEYLYNMDIPEILYKVYPYNFLYIFKKEIIEVLECLKKMTYLKNSYPEILLFNNVYLKIFDKYVERGTV